MPFMPNGVAYVNNLLKMEGIKHQTVDVNIIWYHKFHSQKILGNKKEMVSHSGYAMKEDPWDNANTAEWDKPEVIDFFAKDIESLALSIAQAKPRILGLSLNGTNRLMSQELVNNVRRLYPEVIVLVGGYDCNHPEVGPKLFNNYDYMVIGEAELVIRPLTRALLKGEMPKDLQGVICRYDIPNRIWQPGPLLENLDEIDFPRYEWTDIKIYQDYRGYNMAPITASRGCRWSKCSFCAECFPWRRRDPILVADEFEWLYSHGFTSYQFNESDMNGDPETLMDICREIIRRKLKIVLTGQLRIDRRNSAEFFDILKKAGCNALRFGVDGWSQNTLRIQRKGYAFNVVEDNLKKCQNAGIRVAVNMVIGVPGETDDDIDDTISNIVRLRVYIDIIESINTLILFAGSNYYNNPEKYGIIFRIPKEILYNQNPRVIPPTQWYSENPYIDHKVRLHRLRKVCKSLYKNGVCIGPFAQETISSIERELSEG
jgi:hypothetical protein